MTRARRVSLLAVLLAVLPGAGSRPAGLGDVTDIRVFDHPSYTRVVVELSRRARYHEGTLENPSRLYLDIDEVWVDVAHRSPRDSGKNASVQRVRAGQNTLRRARVVLELDPRGTRHRTFHLEDPFRIVTDVYLEGSALGGVSPESFAERPVRSVMIDPGHGGKDPGALGRGGVREKDIVLRIARELRDQLEKAGLKALLTRERDHYLSLEERTARANAAGVDLFVSIHANASPDRRTHGVETYLLNTRYDRQTARVAARENGTTVDQLSDLQKILASLRLGYNERFAARLAGDTHRSLLRSLRANHRDTPDLGVKRGPFLVLFMADMPAILVEVGFLTHRSEGRRLTSRAFVKAAATGMARGILRYRDEQARRLVAGR